jgi:hypothetical protein
MSWSNVVVTAIVLSTGMAMERTVLAPSEAKILALLEASHFMQ